MMVTKHSYSNLSHLPSSRCMSLISFQERNVLLFDSYISSSWFDFYLSLGFFAGFIFSIVRLGFIGGYDHENLRVPNATPLK